MGSHFQSVCDRRRRLMSTAIMRTMAPNCDRFANHPLFGLSSHRDAVTPMGATTQMARNPYTAPQHDNDLELDCCVPICGKCLWIDVPSLTPSIELVCGPAAQQGQNLVAVAKHAPNTPTTLSSACSLEGAYFRGNEATREVENYFASRGLEVILKVRAVIVLGLRCRSWLSIRRNIRTTKRARRTTRQPLLDHKIRHQLAVGRRDGPHCSIARSAVLVSCFVIPGALLYL